MLDKVVLVFNPSTQEVEHSEFDASQAYIVRHVFKKIVCVCVCVCVCASTRAHVCVYMQGLAVWLSWLLCTSPRPRDAHEARMPSSA